MKDKANNKRWEFIRDHANEEVLDKAQIELYIFIQKLLNDKIDELSQKDRISS